MIGRRDLLKYFGIGTAIVPMIDGMPRLETPATLVQVPSIEPIQLPPAVEVFNPHDVFGASRLNDKVSIEVTIKTESRTYHFAADSFLTRSEVQIVDATTHEDPAGWRRKISVPTGGRWTLEGILATPWRRATVK